MGCVNSNCSNNDDGDHDMSSGNELSADYHPDDMDDRMEYDEEGQQPQHEIGSMLLLLLPFITAVAVLVQIVYGLRQWFSGAGIKNWPCSSKPKNKWYTEKLYNHPRYQSDCWSSAMFIIACSDTDEQWMYEFVLS